MKPTIKSYKTTEIYKTAKEEIKEYKEKYNLDNDSLYLALRLYDLKHLDPSIIKKASSGAQLAAILSGLSLIFVSQNADNKTVALINAIVFMTFFILYIGGFTNQYQNEKRAIRKILKKQGIKEEFITKEEIKAKKDKEED